jgi:hypothetical protein
MAGAPRREQFHLKENSCNYYYYYYYLFITTIELTSGGSTPVHIYKQYTEYREWNIHNNLKKGNCGPCPDFASYTLAFALQLRKKH